MFFHFNRISKNHVQIENQILDLNVQHRMKLKSALIESGFKIEVFHSGPLIPALGRACPVVPHHPQHMSR